MLPKQEHGLGRMPLEGDRSSRELTGDAGWPGREAGEMTGSEHLPAASSGAEVELSLQGKKLRKCSNGLAAAADLLER